MAGQNLSIRMLLSLSAEDFARQLSSATSELDVFATSVQMAARQASDAFGQLGLRSIADIEAQIGSLEDAYAALAESGLVSTEDLARAQAALEQQTARLRAEIEGAGAATEATANDTEGFSGRLRDLAAGLLSLDALGNIFGWITEQVGDLTALADAWSNLKAKLDLATDSQAKSALALERVQAIAQNSASDLSSVGDLYATLARSLESLGDTSTDVAAITQTISQSFAVSGTSSEQAADTITQLAQALASGVLRGDEFNSVMEQAPRLSRALADSLGVTTGELRAMAEEGKLTAQTVIKALGDQADEIAAEMAQMPDTFERATTRLKNSLTAIVGQLNEAVRGSELYSSATATLSSVIQAVAGFLETLGSGLVKIISAFTDLPAPVHAALTAMAATGAAAVLLATNFGAVTTALASMATGLTLVALAAFQSFAAQVGAAIAVVKALWIALLANPLTALIGVFAIATAGLIAYKEASEETLDSVAKTREEINKKSEALNALRATLATAKPGTDAYTEAERKLAQLVPGLTLSLNEQGMVVAKVGKGFEDNARKVDEYAASLEKTDQESLAQQLALTAKAHQEAADKAEAHRQRMVANFGATAEARTGAQAFRLELFDTLGLLDGYNQKAVELNTELRNQATSFRQLAIEALDSGMSIEEVEQQMRDLAISEDTIKSVVEQMKALKVEANSGLTGLSEDQKAVAEAARDAANAVKSALSGIKDEIKRLDEKIDEHRDKLKTALDAETAGWRALGEEAKNAYQGQIEEIDRVTAAQSQAIDTNLGDERQAAAERAALYRQETADRLTATRAYQAQALTLIDEEYDRRKQAARASGESERAINAEYLQARRAVLQEIESAYRSHIDQINSEAQRHLDAVRRIEDEIASLKLSTEDRIRELQRGGMTEYEAYQDRKRQAAEKLSEAERALAEGDFELAQTLSKQAADLYAQNARAVQDGEREIVSQKQATAEAVRGVGEAAGVETRALEAMGEAHQRQADAAKQGATETESALQAVSDQIDALASQLDYELSLKISADSSAVDAEITKLEALLKSKEAVVKISADLTKLQEELKKADTLVKDNPAKLEIVLDKTEKTLGELKAYAAKLGEDVEVKAPLTLSTDRALGRIEDVRGKLLELNGFETASAHTIKSNAEKIKAEIDSLDGRNTSSTHTIYQDTVQRSAAGGLIDPARFASGGAVPGFPVPRWSTVPGAGNTDSVPAALAPGSYVLKKAAARYYGTSLLDLINRFASGGRVPSLLMPGERLFQPGTVSRFGPGFFEALNQMRLPREQILAALGNMTAPVARFAAGGAVGTPSLASNSRTSRDVVDINLQIDERRIQLQGPRDQAKSLAAALRALQRQL